MQPLLQQPQQQQPQLNQPQLNHPPIVLNAGANPPDPVGVEQPPLVLHAPDPVVLEKPPLDARAVKIMANMKRLGKKIPSSVQLNPEVDNHSAIPGEDLYSTLVKEETLELFAHAQTLMVGALSHVQ
jgi:hypothetical protein